MHNIVSNGGQSAKNGTNIDKTAIRKKVDIVVKLVTSHILKGNDFKLLALPENAETDEEEK